MVVHLLAWQIRWFGYNPSFSSCSNYFPSSLWDVHLCAERGLVLSMHSNTRTLATHSGHISIAFLLHIFVIGFISTMIRSLILVGHYDVWKGAWLFTIALHTSHIIWLFQIATRMWCHQNVIWIERLHLLLIVSFICEQGNNYAHWYGSLRDWKSSDKIMRQSHKTPHETKTRIGLCKF